MSAVAGNNNRIRVAVVGAGEFGRNHARVYRELPTADLVGVAGRGVQQDPVPGTWCPADFQARDRDREGGGGNVSVL